MKRVFVPLAAFLAIGAIALLAGGWEVKRFLETPVSVPEDGIAWEIAPGTPFAAVSEELAAAGIVSHPRLFRWYARFRDDAHRIHAGEYWLAPGATPPDLLRDFVKGNVRLHSFTIVEGWTYRDLVAALGRHEALEPAIAGSDPESHWEDLREWLGAGETHPEGLFLPETYWFPRRTADREILRQAYRMMAEALEAEWQARAEGLPLGNPYEALILASIIERETGREDERARIAGVFVRRLQQGMRLQTDPTVIYGIGPEFDGNLTRLDLRTPTPYNTYTQAGLPPTPIAMPGRAAIHAALNPAPGTELYFVATGLGDGSHKFSDTREEHEAAVQEYLQRLRQSRRNAEAGSDN